MIEPQTGPQPADPPHRRESGDEAADLAVLRDYYQNKKAYDPARAGDIVFLRR